MRNEAAVTIRKASTAVAVGLLEEALEREGRKGCTAILCTEPTRLEPPYTRFDSAHILQTQSRQDEESEPSPASEELVTFNVYPAEEDQLSLGWMETMLKALATQPGPMTFELYSQDGMVWVRFAIPKSQEPGFRAGLLGHFPSLALQPVEDAFPGLHESRCWVNELCPVGPYHRHLSLLGKEGASPLGLAVQAMQDLGNGKGLFQVLLCPPRFGHDWHYNVENMAEAETKAAQLALLGGLSTDFSYDHELPPRLDPGVGEKVGLDVAFFATQTRYATWNTTQEKADEFLQAMRVATGMLRFGGRTWRTLTQEDLENVLGENGVKAMVRRRVSHRPGIMLTSREVASIVHIPNARALSMLASLQQRTGWKWKPPKPKGQEGHGEGAACLGLNDYAGQTQPVEIPLGVRLRHMYISGTTGSGKSKLLERLAVDDAEGGMGFCLVDPHGDLCRDVLEKLPEDRLEDLVYVSFSESGHVPKWNPFRSRVASGKLADDMARAFLAQAGTTGARMEHNFRMLAYTTHQLQGTLDDFAELAARTPRGQRLREKALEQVPNPQVQRFLRHELPKYSARELSSVTNKLSRLLLDDQLGSMFRQEQNELHPREWMDQGRVVLVNLSSGHIGSDHARFVGCMLVSLIYRASLTRTNPKKRRPFILYVDEFQALQGATLPEILSEGRKYGLGSVLAHQERGQLGKDVSHALGNAATKVLFRPSEDDLTHYARITGNRVDADVFRGLTVGQAIVSYEGRLANLRTELCQAAKLRDANRVASLYAKKNYHATDEDDDAVEGLVRRPRVYDTFQ